MPDDAGELAPGDLATYSRGRLDAADPGTKDALVAALAAARRFCRWHVTPVRTETLVLDGPGSPLLSLPTQQITDLTTVSVTERAVLLDPATLYVSKAGKIRKVTGGKWTRRYSGLQVTLTHGWAEAEDFQRAVLSYADRLSLATTGGRRVVVGPFQYQPEEMSGTKATGATSAFSAQETSLLSQYRIEGRP